MTTTAGGLLLAGELNGDFVAFDAVTFGTDSIPVARLVVVFALDAALMRGWVPGQSRSTTGLGIRVSADSKVPVLAAPRPQ